MKKPKDSQSNLSKTKNNIRVIVRRLNSKSKQDVCSGNISLNACCKTMVIWLGAAEQQLCESSCSILSRCPSCVLLCFVSYLL